MFFVEILPFKGWKRPFSAKNRNLGTFLGKKKFPPMLRRKSGLGRGQKHYLEGKNEKWENKKRSINVVQPGLFFWLKKEQKHKRNRRKSIEKRDRKNEKRDRKCLLLVWDREPAPQKVHKWEFSITYYLLYLYLIFLVQQQQQQQQQQLLYSRKRAKKRDPVRIGKKGFWGTSRGPIRPC